MPSLHPFSYRRFATREVMVGDVGVGGDNPLRIQSMTTPATTDVAATVGQIERLVDVGCEIVRVTVPSKADADALPTIRAEMAMRRLRVPLVADIHFTPQAAMLAVEHVEKVRINPGNFADKKRFEQRDYSDAEYAAELERIAERFVPLVRRARELGVALRIGTNHGSLSDRIMNRFGDTANGMVESALEFIRIAASEGHHGQIVSMKSSNPLVAIEAYRLLVARMKAEGMAYPLHLGVTEAGDGEDGRIKSAIGIGALLDEGIGDTIRVSLTEDPVAEVPVAFALAAPYNERRCADAIPELNTVPEVVARSGRRATRPVSLGPIMIGDGETIRTEVRLRTPLSNTETLHHEIAAVAGYGLPEGKKVELLVLDVESGEDAQALVALRRLFDEHHVEVPLAATLAPTLMHRVGELGELFAAVARVGGLPPTDDHAPSWDAAVTSLAQAARDAGVPLAIEASPAIVPHFLATTVGGELEAPIETVVRATRLARAVGAEVTVAVWVTAPPGPAHAVRLLAARLDAEGLDVPIVGVHQREAGTQSLLAASVHIGALIADGFLDSVRIDGGPAAVADVRLAYDLLQATRHRIIKTEFISCPSCGRTLFDLEETTRRIKARTGHLKGLKIAIMGCVVNGPGEMADADFGYVGWGPGKIALFAGKEMVAKDIPTAVADQRLVELIQERGRWIEPSATP